MTDTVIDQHAEARAISVMLERLRAQILMVQELSASDTPDAEQVRALLPIVGEALAINQELEQLLFNWRLALWRTGRRTMPAVTNPELGRLAGVTEVAVMKQLRIDRDRNEDEAREANR